MGRPPLDIADIFRRHGAAWRRAQAGHLSLGQLKVMAAIEACRTAALGGHVERCEDCGRERVAYNSCRNRHCPKCQGAAARDWLAAREADLLPVPVLPRRLHPAGRDRRRRLPEQDGRLRPPVPGLVRGAADHRRRSQAPRRPHRRHRRAPHMGLGDDPPPACPHDRAGRRHLARRRELGPLPAGLPPAGARALPPVPPAHARRPRRRPCRRPAGLLRRPRAP